MIPFPVAPGRIGAVPYLNALPLIHGIEKLVHVAPPAALADALRAGKLDVALVPVHEALVCSGYLAVDGVSIASDGDVFSVAVFHRGDASVPRRIWLDPDSRTSCLLTKVLYGGENGTEFLDSSSITKCANGGDGILRIGDPAIQMRLECGPGVRVRDLGGDWKRATGKPFVYALWLIRPDFSAAKETALALQAVARQGRGQIDAIARSQTKFPSGLAAHYLREHIDHSCGERHWAGLQEFRDRAVTCGILPETAELPTRT